MSWLARIFVAVIANIIGLTAAGYFVSDFRLPWDIKQILILALILTALNFFLKPILKLILSPVVFLTLGFGVLIINAAILYLLDFLSPALTISGLLPLIYSTLIISSVNFIYHLANRS